MDDKKDRSLKGGAQMLRDADFIISVSKTPDDGNSRIKVIRSKFTPANETGNRD